jgi:hypothetical protein
MREMRTRLLMPLLALLLAAAAPPLPSQLNDPDTTEGWIWQQVQAGKVADLNDRCGSLPLDIHQREDTRWRAPCRRVDPVLLRALLAQPDLADHAPHGFLIRGARVEGNLDFDDIHVRAPEVWLDASWIAGYANLSDARLDGLLSLTGTLIEGTLNGERAFIGSSLVMRGAEFAGQVDLRDTHIGGQLDMERASLADTQAFDAERLRVGAGGLLLRKVTFGGSVGLRNAHVEGQMDMEGASVSANQMFDAELLHVGTGGLFLRKVTFGGPVALRDAHVDGQLDMDGASIADMQAFDAERLHVGTGGLLLRNVVFGGPVALRDVHVDGQMDMEGARIAAGQTFNGERLHVGSSFFARSASFGGDANFLVLTVDGSLDLRDSHVRQLALGGAVVRNDLLLGGEGLWLRWDSCDGPAPCLNLRNARVGNLQDDEGAWPERITLAGFAYTHLGGIGGEQRQDMRNRPTGWWRGWLDKDPVYSSQPYAQLANVLTASGNREGAADIRFFGRDRERSELLRGCTWLQEIGLAEKPDDDRPCRWGAGLGLSALQVFVGHGIGAYTFRAAGWALVLAAIGTIILLFAPGVRGARPVRFLTRAPRGPRQKSLLWCFGASLHHVLPLVTLSQEFTDFFNDPKRERLLAWQQVVFGMLALCGWALGLFVAAAFSGLIQS